MIIQCTTNDQLNKCKAILIDSSGFAYTTKCEGLKRKVGDKHQMCARETTALE